MSLEEKYPFIASWVRDGQIQIGQSEYYDPVATVIDPGSVVWETNEPCASLDELLTEMERGIGRWCKEEGIELADRQGRVIPWPEE
jgi:hypothetical protein